MDGLELPGDQALEIHHSLTLQTCLSLVARSRTPTELQNQQSGRPRIKPPLRF